MKFPTESKHRIHVPNHQPVKITELTEWYADSLNSLMTL